MSSRSGNIPHVPKRKPKRQTRSESHSAQHELQCRACGHQCSFEPELEALACPGCGNVQLIEVFEHTEARREFPFDPTAPDAEPRGSPPEQEHQCSSCGGTVHFLGESISERCPYCDGSMVLVPGTAGFDATALIPFRITSDEAQKRAMDWVESRRAGPRGLSRHVSDTARIAGLYVPFWTFDTSESLTYTAIKMEYEAKRMVTRSTSGHHDVEFDDLLAPASPHVTPLIRDCILHEFEPTSLRSFDARYLAGFAAERHHQSVVEGFAANMSDKEVLAKQQVRDGSAIDSSTALALRTDSISARYRRILLPVWIFHYDHSNRAYKIVVSGINGRTFGQRPFSTFKLVLLSGLFSFLVVLLGILMGMSIA